MRSWISLLMICLSFTLGACGSKINEGKVDAESATVPETKGCQGAACAVCELPWGGTLAPGEVLQEAYSQSLVGCGETCDSARVSLKCVDGKLEATTAQGTPFELISSLTKTCHKKRCDCTYAGVVVEEGLKRDFFKSGSVACGGACESRSFTCSDGKLVDTEAPTAASTIANYPSAACAVAACKACVAPWGASVAHLGTIASYSADVPTCGQACSTVQKTLTCNDGVLSGANLANFKFGTCTSRACQSCTLPSGDIISHNASPRIYSMKTAQCGTSCSANSVVLTCKDGVITGGDPAVYQYTSCSSVACKNCVLPCGTTIGSGGSGYCYKASAPPSCGMTCLAERKRFSCLDGVISVEDGTPIANNLNYDQKSCADRAACSSCPLPDGRQVIDGSKVTFFKKADLGCGESCFTTSNAVTLTCSNGSFANQLLYSDYRELECSSSCTTSTGDQGIGRVAGDGGGAPVVWCQVPWSGHWASHGATITAFSVTKPPAGAKCSSYKAQITCNAYRGLWSGGGTYIYSMCKE